MLPSEYLNKAADMLEKPGAWCRGASARDAEDKPVPMGGTNAVQHCMDGALYELSIERRKTDSLTVNVQIAEYKAAVEVLRGPCVLLVGLTGANIKRVSRGA